MTVCKVGRWSEWPRRWRLAKMSHFLQKKSLLFRKYHLRIQYFSISAPWTCWLDFYHSAVITCNLISFSFFFIIPAPTLDTTRQNSQLRWVVFASVFVFVFSFVFVFVFVFFLYQYLNLYLYLYLFFFVFFAGGVTRPLNTFFITWLCTAKILTYAEQRPKKSKLSRWQTLARINFPNEAGKGGLQSKKNVSIRALPELAKKKPPPTPQFGQLYRLFPLRDHWRDFFLK